MATMQEEMKAVAEKHLSPLREKAKELRKELKKVENEIASGEAALAAVVGGTKKKKSSTNSNSGKPAADDAKCSELLEKAVTENNGIPIKDAIALATDKLKEQNFSTQGQYQRLKALVLKSDNIEVKADKCSLVKG